MMPGMSHLILSMSACRLTDGSPCMVEWFRRKWYLFPFPQTEILKGYLVQNPGWNPPEVIS